VVNICVLLQTIDQDGNLNNGIKISKPISTIVSKYAGLINFDQTTAAFMVMPGVFFNTPPLAKT
jgi:para-nitrobenzyl esterase